MKRKKKEELTAAQKSIIKAVDRIHELYPSHQELLDSKSKYAKFVDLVVGNNGTQKIWLSFVSKQRNAWEGTAGFINLACAKAFDRELYSNGYSFRRVGQWANNSKGTIELNDVQDGVIEEPFTFSEFSAILKVIFLSFAGMMTDEQYDASIALKASHDKFYRVLD